MDSTEIHCSKLYTLQDNILKACFEKLSVFWYICDYEENLGGSFWGCSNGNTYYNLQLLK